MQEKRKRKRLFVSVVYNFFTISEQTCAFFHRWSRIAGCRGRQPLQAFSSGVCPRFASTETDEESRFVRCSIIGRGSRAVEGASPYGSVRRSVVGRRLRTVEDAGPYGCRSRIHLIRRLRRHLPPLGKATDIHSPLTDGMFVIILKKDIISVCC